MPARDLRRVVKTVAPAAERYDDSLPALNAVSITRDPANGVEFTATDRYRLHTVQLAERLERAWTQDGSADTCAGLVPAWWLRRWARERTTESGSATLTIRDDRASIEWGTESWTTTLVTGDFPDWRGKLAGGLSDAEGEVSVTSPTAIGYNPRYLSALMKAAARWGACAGTPNPLRVQRFDAAKPFHGAVVNPEFGRLLLLLMPVRFSDGAA
jgi:hypothetical protein